MTCLAVWAAIRVRRAESISRPATTATMRPVFRSTVAVASVSSLTPSLFLAALATADSIAWMRMSRSMPLSRSMALRIASSSPFICLFSRLAG
jgi:hypothetical protein